MFEFSNNQSKSQPQSSRTATVTTPTSITLRSDPTIGAIAPLESPGTTAMSLADELQTHWLTHLQADLPNGGMLEPIVQWLIGGDRDRFTKLTPEQLVIVQQAMDYRYRILKERYLGMSQERAYRNLMQRLGSVFVLRSKIKTWISLSRDRQRSVAEVLQEIIQEMLQNDTYMQQQIAWIAQCTSDLRLRNALVLASLEEYCLRPIRNQPLLACRFINYLRRSQRGGMTNVPTSEFVRFVSEEIAPDDNEGSVSLLDNQAIADYQEEQTLAEQQELRQAVVRRLADYLNEKVEPLAAEWLNLYLQGKSQEAIAQDLDIPIKQVYRLREKVSYHALKVFASKKQTELVAEWLGEARSAI
jgi:DNA-directed RNA polymerase specialized sigma24 family protein